MTEENQKRRASLLEVEAAVHSALAAQPADDDPVRCGMALDRGMVRIAGVAYRYMLDHVDRTDTSQCQVCRKPLGDGKAHRIWFGPPDALPANAVLCTKCYDDMCELLRKAAIGRGGSLQWTILNGQTLRCAMVSRTLAKPRRLI